MKNIKKEIKDGCNKFVLFFGVIFVVLWDVV